MIDKFVYISSLFSIFWIVSADLGSVGLVPPVAVAGISCSMVRNTGIISEKQKPLARIEIVNWTEAFRGYGNFGLWWNRTW